MGFVSVNMGSVRQFLCRKIVFFLGAFWLFVSTCFRVLFGFFRTRLFRFKFSDNFSKDCLRHSEFSSEVKSQKDSNPIKPKPELQSEKDGTKIETKQEAFDLTDGLGLKNSEEFCFKFKFPTYEEFSRSRGEKGDPSISIERASGSSVSMLVDVSVQEAEVESFNAKELNREMGGGPFSDQSSVDDGFLSDEDFTQIHSEAKAIHPEAPEEDPTMSPCSVEAPAKIEARTFAEEKGKIVDEGINLLLHEDVSNEIQVDTDSESMGSSPLRRVMNRLIDSYSDEFLSDSDFGGELKLENFPDGEEEESPDEMSDLDETHLDGSDKEDTYTEEELRKIEEAHFRSVGNLNSDFLSENDFRGKEEDISKHEGKPGEAADDSGKASAKNSSEWDAEQSNKLETLWEHQELIEQLRMELRKVRATGLPTILEESECPKIADDLKPWKIDERFLHADRMDELHKFYKSYRERMRKFDILNYQKMYAMGFLQQKDPLQSLSSQKSSASSVFSPNLRLFRRKKIGNDPMMKFIKELQSDLEVVYVGQMCLSWEILHWQYGKALELWDSDPRGIHQYNEVAGEFQQFQVLLQRFIEDGPFQGPRVQNYVKSRCVLRNLLQVPVIREDSTKDKKKGIKRRERGEYTITSDLLVETIEESIRIFWRFIRADKDCSNAIGKCRTGAPAELQDPADLDLLMEVRANVQKKERKLKELLRCGNCILKRFQKCEEDDSDHVFFFFSQVDMKLVSRVLNMSRLTTDQLLWCRQKLDKINFVHRKIRVDPSFCSSPVDIYCTKPGSIHT
ncbi:hypothetical protein NMG60_11006460 [Bertholletia excelsa]